MKRKDLSPIVVNTVFISSTARDLSALRKAVAYLQQQRFGVTESFPEHEWNPSMPPEEIVAECRRRVMSADAVVLILGPWAGTILPGYTESITHLEFRWARERFGRLYQKIEELAEQRNLRELLSLYIPRILVLTPQSADKRWREIMREDGGAAWHRLEKNIRPLLEGLTNAEREGIKKSRASIRQEVYEAVDAREALLCSFNNMDEMLQEVLETITRWSTFSAQLLQLISRA